MANILDRCFPREHLLKKEALFDFDAKNPNSCLLVPRPGIDKVTLACYQWDLYAVSYKYAADLIINKGLDAFFNGLDTWHVDLKDYYILADKVDVAVLPVIFLYRQYLGSLP